ncbi:MAG: hypothetical protein GEV09_18805 [Pseudonocardiaceae bacterium]|nr:hypothetical protein [Pseudonocardiaceae bacterium]
MAEIYEHEARVWSLWFEQTERRLQWRAALSAQAYARACARSWRTQAAAYRRRFGRLEPLSTQRAGWRP